MSEKIVLEPDAQHGWRAPKKGRDTGGTVFTVRYTDLIQMLREAGRLDSHETACRIRIDQNGIDIFVDRAPRTIGEYR